MVAVLTDMHSSCLQPTMRSAGQIGHILSVVVNSVLATGGRWGGVPKTARRIREAGAIAANEEVLNISLAVWNTVFHWWRSGNKKRSIAMNVKC